MTPSEFTADQGISQKQFGQLFNPPVSQGLVSQWFRGVTKMTLEQALQAFEFSEGLITAEECANLFRQHERLSQESSVSSIPDGLVPSPQGLGSFSAEVQRG